MKRRHFKRARILCNIFATLVGILAAVVLSGVLYIIFGKMIHVNQKKESVSETTTVEVETTAVAQAEKNTTIYEEADDGVSIPDTGDVEGNYFDNTVFLGDSRTVALAAFDLIPQANTFAENGIAHTTFMEKQWTDTISGTVGDIFSIVSARQPERIYVALGVNGVGYMDSETFTTTYTAMVQRLVANAPNSILVLEAILPVNESLIASEDGVSNEQIGEYNSEIKKIAKKVNAWYLDPSEAVADETGNIAAEFDNGDGLHFNEAGCHAIYDYMSTHGVYEKN